MSGATVAALSATRSVTIIPVVWVDLAGLDSNADKTMSGPSDAVTIKFTYGGGGASNDLKYHLNSGAGVSIANLATLSVNPGDLLHFEDTKANTGGTGTMSVTNSSDGNASVGSFSFSK